MLFSHKVWFKSARSSQSRARNWLINAQISSHKRIGGEIPTLSERMSRVEHWQSNWLPFSHGRAALAWLIERQGFKSAVICAYTCLTVPQFLRSRDLKIGTFDVGAEVRDVASIAEKLPRPCLILIPALFGSPPWLDIQALQRALPPDLIVIDAAQTAFGHVDFLPPASGAVLSCPRKATGLSDGAILAVARGLGFRRDISDLPVATIAAALKAAARALWATGDPTLEKQALIYNRRSEEGLPQAPHRMSDEALIGLSNLDRRWHAMRRRRNCRFLMEALGNRLPMWASRRGTPFCLPIFVRNQKATLETLCEKRLFATALWPDAEFKKPYHPGAAWIAQHLVSLPVDQQYNEADMRRVASAMARSAEPPSKQPPYAIKGLIRSLTR